MNSNPENAAEAANIDVRIEYLVGLPYRREILPNGDGTWFARVVEFRGCLAEGSSQGEALKALESVMRDWLRAQLEDGRPIPQPSAPSAYNGKLLVRLPRSVHRDLAERAERESVSVNTFVVQAIARALGDVPPETVQPKRVDAPVAQFSFAFSDLFVDSAHNLTLLSAPSGYGKTVPTLVQITELNTSFASQLLEQQKALASRLAEICSLADKAGRKHETDF